MWERCDRGCWSEWLASWYKARAKGEKLKQVGTKTRKPLVVGDEELGLAADCRNEGEASISRWKSTTRASCERAW